MRSRTATPPATGTNRLSRNAISLPAGCEPAACSEPATSCPRRTVSCSIMPPSRSATSTRPPEATPRPAGAKPAVSTHGSSILVGSVAVAWTTQMRPPAASGRPGDRDRGVRGSRGENRLRPEARRADRREVGRPVRGDRLVVGGDDPVAARHHRPRVGGIRDRVDLTERGRIELRDRPLRVRGVQRAAGARQPGPSRRRDDRTGAGTRRGRRRRRRAARASPRGEDGDGGGHGREHDDADDDQRSARHRESTSGLARDRRLRLLALDQRGGLGR